MKYLYDKNEYVRFYNDFNEFEQHLRRRVGKIVKLFPGKVYWISYYPDSKYICTYEFSEKELEKLTETEQQFYKVMYG